jgi:hypothetical protein
MRKPPLPQRGTDQVGVPPFCHTFRLAFDCPVSIQLYVGLHPCGDRVISAQREKRAPAEAAADLVDARHDRRARHRKQIRPVGTEHCDGHANISRRSVDRSPRRNSRYFGFSPRRCRGATLPSGIRFAQHRENHQRVSIAGLESPTGHGVKRGRELGIL